MSEVVVRVKQGELKGIVQKSADGKVYYSFMGIPFAEAPVGKLRFQNPVPAKSWNGIRDATKEGGICAQANVFTGLFEYSGGDDCLYINVHTPCLKTERGPPLPVLVNIHGGGFVNWSGSSDILGPEYIMEQDTIMVSFNYRLGILGFLCTDAENARGDMGLLDQQLALQWVKENIAAFNGDDNNITLFGISAGSASVEYHLLSKKSHGYFNKAILQSGSVLNHWARIKTPIDHAIRLAKVFGYKSESTDGLFEFINAIDTKDLVMASATLMKNEDLKKGSFFAFVPVVNEFKDGKGFLTDEPIDILKKGEFNNVSIISGLCDIEGMMIRLFFANEEMKTILNNSRFLECLPSFLNKNMDNCEGRLKNIYKPSDHDRNPDDHIMAYLSDLCFNGGVFASLEQRLKHNKNNEYFYRFAYEGNMNLMKLLLNFKDNGTCHADDSAYLGPNSAIPRDNATETDILIKNRMVKMWTNFAKYGNPTPCTDEIITEKWSPTTGDEFKYLHITNELKMSSQLWPERKQLWNDLYKNI